jgi:hypothetical protein
MNLRNMKFALPPENPVWTPSHRLATAVSVRTHLFPRAAEMGHKY